MPSFHRRLWLFISLVTAVALLTGCSALGSTATSSSSSSRTIGSVGTVKTITAVTSVSGAGSTLALQTVAVNWKTTSMVGTVAVKAGDQVKAGQVLMTMAPESVSTAQLQAQATRSSSLKH